MSETIAPSQQYTFTVQRVPEKQSHRKTLQRLMYMQPDIQRGLDHLARRRRQKDNITTIRAGCEWVIRKRTTKLVNLEPGATFTLRLTPQILPDVRSVERYLDITPA